jgi:hypothetical protein
VSEDLDASVQPVRSASRSSKCFRRDPAARRSRRETADAVRGLSVDRIGPPWALAWPTSPSAAFRGPAVFSGSTSRGIRAPTSRTPCCSTRSAAASTAPSRRSRSRSTATGRASPRARSRPASRGSRGS